MNFIVGITGGIGSGKSALTERLQQRGITVVDADLAARTIVQPGSNALTAIRQHFGSSMLLADGSLNRPALRQRVFADEVERHWLEQLTHPLIAQEIDHQLSSSTSPYTVLSSPLLLETSQHQRVDYIVVVDVPEALQRQRSMQRDGNDEAQIKRIMAAQLPREQRLQKADSVIDNSQSLSALDKHVEQLHRQLLQMASTRQS